MADYYISSAGNDSNDGSIGSPWLTLSKAQTTVQANDTIYLNRGDEWREVFTTPANGLTIDAYGSGAKPVITGAVDQSSGWTYTGIGGWWFKVSTDLGVVLEDGAPMTFIEWDTDFATTTAGATAGSFTYWIGSNVLYVWVSDSTDPGTHTIDVATRDYCIDNDGYDNVTIQNIECQMAAQHCILVENSDSVAISNVTVQKCGGKYVSTVYLGNGIQFGDGCSNCSAVDVDYDHIFDSAVTAQTYSNGATVLNTTLTRVTGKRAGFAGIEIIVTGTSTNSYVDGVTITDCEASACGYGFSGQRYNNKGNGLHLESPTGVATSYLKNITVSGGKFFNNVGNGIFGLEDLGLVDISNVLVFGNLLDGVVMGATTAPNNCGILFKKSVIHSNVGHGIFYANSDGAKAQIDFNTIVANGNNSNTKYNVLFTDINTALADNSFRFNKCAGRLSYTLAAQFTNENMVMDSNTYAELETAKVINFNSVEYDTADLAAYQTASGREASSKFKSTARYRLCPVRPAKVA